MKNAFFSTLKISFIIIGSIIGAGFITGKEILRFFLGLNLELSCLLCGLLFFFSLLAILYLGDKYKSYDNSNKALFGSKARCVDIIMFIGSVVTVSGMLAGIDSLIKEEFNFTIPILSILSLFLSHIICKRGIDSLSKVNALLVSVMLVFLLIAFLPCFKGDINVYDFEYRNYSFVLIYVGINVFLASPLLVTAGGVYDKKSFVLSSAIISVIVCILIYIIMKSLLSIGESVLRADIPILKALGKNRNLKSILAIMIYFGIFTTLISSYYPLLEKINSTKNKKRNLSILIVVIFLLSRLGLDKIVYFLYPAIGVFGVIYILFVVKRIFIDKLRVKEEKTAKKPNFKLN